MTKQRIVCFLFFGFAAALLQIGCSETDEIDEESSGIDMDADTDTPASSQEMVADRPSFTCVLDVDTGEQNCYSSFTEAMSAATNGQINDAPANSGVAAQDKELSARVNAIGRARSAEASERTDTVQEPVTVESGDVVTVHQAITVGSGDVVQGYLYEDEYYNYYGLGDGWTMIVKGNKQCSDSTDDVDHGFPWIGSAFNDMVTSVVGENNCCFTLYWDDHYNGDWMWTCGTPNVGSYFNDKTSSFELT